MSVQENINLEKKLFDVFNKHNIKEGEQFIDEKCQFINVPFDMKAVGREGYRNFVGGWDKAFPDAKCEITNMIANEDSVTTEFNAVGTHKGVLITPEGEIAPTGKHVNVPFLEVDKIKNGKIVESKIYFDSLTLFHQVGLVNKRDLLTEIKHH